MSSKGTYKWPDGRSFEGEWKDGQWHGKGIEKRYSYDGSVVYDGEFKVGLQDGKGTYNYGNGDVFNGEWREGKKQGMGVMTYANQDIYEGEWKEDKRHGNGSFKLSTGDVISGQWINDHTISLLTSRKRAANDPQGNESEAQPAAKRPHLEELQSTNAQLHKNNEELQGQVVANEKVIVEKDEVIKMKDDDSHR